MDTSAAIAVLTAMITPAVLISACGSMILSTSSRLGRVVDRVRSLSDRLEEMAERRERGEMATERQASISRAALSDWRPVEPQSRVRTPYGPKIECGGGRRSTSV